MRSSATSPIPHRPNSALAKAAAAHGPARILVNCAGVGVAKRVVGRDGPQPLGDFEAVIRVNLIGTFNMIRLFAAAASRLDPLADGERGVVVNTASVAAYEGQVGQAAYSASKGGVVAMTLPIARELAQFGVRVNAIAPGLFLTPMLLGLPQEAQQSLGRSVPYPARLGDPAEYAALAAFIVENPYLNGETIRIDGALRLRAALEGRQCSSTVTPCGSSGPIATRPASSITRAISPCSTPRRTICSRRRDGRSATC